MFVRSYTLLHTFMASFARKELETVLTKDVLKNKASSTFRFVSFPNTRILWEKG